MIRPSTFSIVGVDRAAGEIGIAVASKFLSVGAVVPWVRAGVGAIATQAFANTRFGPEALAGLALGVTAPEVARRLVSGDDERDDRQFGIVGVDGSSESFTGARCIDHASGIAGDGFAAQGNCLASAAVVAALAETFRETRGALCDRLLAALRAAQDAGGDKRGQQSAALFIEKPNGGYAGFNDRYVDLRVDDASRPIDELVRLLELHKLYYFEAAPEDVLEIDARVGRDLVANLKRVGVLSADVGTYDDRAAAALVALMHVENLENRVRTDGRIDRRTCEYVAAMPDA